MEWADHWSRDGKLFLYGRSEPGSKESIWALPLDGERQPFVVVDSSSGHDEAQLSPDGQWLAYTSDESGHFDVYVKSFGWQGDRVRLDRGRRPAEVARRRARAVLLRARRHDDERERAAWGDRHTSPVIPIDATADRVSRRIHHDA